MICLITSDELYMWEVPGGKICDTGSPSLYNGPWWKDFDKCSCENELETKYSFLILMVDCPPKGN